VESLADQLRTAGVASPAKTRQVPVSRVSFLLTDRTAFDKAVQASVAWMGSTAASDLPAEALEGNDFAFVAPDNRAEISALNIADDQGRIWAARISYRGDRVAGREWLTDLFVERRHGSFVRFGAQLTCKCSLDDPGFDHSRPRVVRDILGTLAGEADGEPLSNEVETVASADVQQLVSLLYNPIRRLPVVVISVDDHGGAQIDLERLATRLSGAAHLRCLSIEPSFELTRQIGKRMSAFNGAIRLYMPGLDQESENPFQHPLWLAPATGMNPRALNQIASRILPLGFRDPEGDARFWRVGLLRQASSRIAANEALGNREEQLQAEIDALQLEKTVLVESTEAAESLMYEEASKLSAVQSEVARLEEENYNLGQRLRAVSTAGGNSSSRLLEDDIQSLFDQNPSLESSLRIVDYVFPNRLEILDSAYESARESYGFKHRKKAFSLLWSLCTDYWTALSAGEGDVTARRCFGAGYAAKESETLSAPGRKRRTFSCGGQELLMEKHLKIGVADNKTETLRVHFEWLADRKVIVVGHCGGHLDF
jgi:hypothetical protein